MGEVLRAEGFRFFFWSNEGSEPPHVHVERGDGYAKYWLAPVRFDYSVGFNRFPKLREASDSDRRKWRFIGRGIGIHWEGLDEDIFVQGLLAPDIYKPPGLRARAR